MIYREEKNPFEQKKNKHRKEKRAFGMIKVCIMYVKVRNIGCKEKSKGTCDENVHRKNLADVLADKSIVCY